MASQVVLLTFPESANAFEAFTKLKQLDGGPVTVHSAGVITRDDNGRLSVEDGAGGSDGTGTLGGGLIGSLVGILGGPVGVLFGWATGALIGGVSDASDDADSVALLDSVSNAIPPGETALVAHVDESTPEPIDQLALGGSGQVQRWDAEQLFADIEAAQSAEAAEAKEARKQAKQAKREQRTENLREKFSKHEKP